LPRDSALHSYLILSFTEPSGVTSADVAAVVYYNRPMRPDVAGHALLSGASAYQIARA